MCLLEPGKLFSGDAPASADANGTDAPRSAECSYRFRRELQMFRGFFGRKENLVRIGCDGAGCFDEGFHLRAFCSFSTLGCAGGGTTSPCGADEIARSKELASDCETRAKSNRQPGQEGKEAHPV